ncbi:MAG: 2-amino-4-ketopentanoate thiolase [delta proteobacterium ML8_F1]|nr:MAG: 2-amino-4-ketopentanoate thiolase [delta proteobacterium ML8_F1]
MDAHKGQWVKIYRVILTKEERAPQVPEDTRQVPLEMWVKGELLEQEASVGDQVTVKTLTGRMESGRLEEVEPSYRHSFGEFVPELHQVGITLREILFGGGSR